MDASHAQRQIQLLTRQELVEATDAGDDWTGIGDSALRRRLQTRLNTRAYRRRKALQQDDATRHGTSKQVAARFENSIPCWDEQRQTVFYLPESAARTLSRQHRPFFLEDGTPIRVLFPLSPDHLITLIQINVIRACKINAELVLGRMAIESEDCTAGSLHVTPIVKQVGQLPESLAPTYLQSTVPHELWVDCFPHPVWRDNFIKALGTFDEDELCSDTVGSLFEGGVDVDCLEHGLIVWSPPWHFDGWELSEGFVRKWGWSIKGCEEVLEATNRWRRRRGEKALVVEIE